MTYFIFGGIFSFLAFYFILVRKRKMRILDKMLDSNSMSLSDLKKELEKGNTFDLKKIEVSGTIKSTTPLTAPFSVSKCVFYNIQVELIYLKKVKTSHSKNVKWESHSQIIYEGEEFLDEIVISDGTGHATLNLKGAELTPVTSYNSQNKKNKLVLPKGLNNHPNLKKAINDKFKEFLKENTDIEISTFKLLEYSLPLNKNLFVYGGVGLKDDLPILMKKDNHTFIVSVKTSQEFYQNMDGELQRYFIAAISFGFLAIFCILLGLKF